jgi:NADH-quinone oxidoreductase subunit H
MTGFEFYAIVIKVVLVFVALLSAVSPMVWLERKGSAWIQLRTGPNRTSIAGFALWGLIQPFADAIKLFVKEDLTPGKANKVLFSLAPIVALFTALLAFAVIPFGSTLDLGRLGEVQLIIADVNVGVLFLLAVTSLAVYGVILAGWSSANRYSLLGGLRASAQMISYELAMGLAVVGVLMEASSLRLPDVVMHQAGYWQGFVPKWHIFQFQPLGALIFLICIFAETNRTPFDMPEADSELVAGYHTEYSSMRFSMFFMAEYINMVTMSALMVVLFLGGWHFPGMDELGVWLGSRTGFMWIPGIMSMMVFAGKVAFLLFLFVWVRWTVPRFRYDQLMGLGWKVLLPLALLQILATGVAIAFGWI